MQMKPPEHKELPVIEGPSNKGSSLRSGAFICKGQVPKDAGVEGMHTIDFKAFWEKSLFKFFVNLFRSLSRCHGIQEILSC